MAYDDDGSLMININNGIVTPYNTASTVISNSEDNTLLLEWSGLGDYGGKIGIIFPELRDITHAFRNISGSSSAYTAPYEVSSNTTNGIDGDWSNTVTVTGYNQVTVPNFREYIVPLSNNGVKGIRMDGPITGTYTSFAYAKWHLYGYKTAGQTPHRIDFCDSSGNELAQDFDYGDQPRNSSRIWSTVDTWNQAGGLYLKNRSTTKLATTVTVSFETLTGDMATYLGLSKDNVTYGNTVVYTSMNPQDIVGPIYVRHNPTIAANLGVKAARLQVAVGTWS